MDLSIITKDNTWGIAASAFSNPMYLSGPAGTTGNDNSAGFDISAGASVMVAFQGTYTGAIVVHEQTVDKSGQSGWFPVDGSPADGGTPASNGCTSGVCYIFPIVGVRHRVKVSALTDGTIEARIRIESEALAAGAGSAASGLAQESTLEAVSAKLDTLINSNAAIETAVESTDPVATFPKPTTLVSGLTAAMTGTTSTAVTGVGAGGTGVFNYITHIIVGNSHASVGTFVELQDGNGGSTFFTVPAAPAYGGSAIALPTPLKQPTANTALYAKNTTTGANVIVGVVGFQAP